MKTHWVLLAATGALALAGATASASAQEIEQPNYAVVEQDGAIEVRQYDPMIVAEATVSGQRGTAMNRGFRLIADYIFGNNISSEKVAMTSPVTQQPVSEKIAMTSPVTQQQAGDEWRVRFIMPSEYTMETLPVPNNPRVTLLEVPGKRVASIRFSGRGGMRDLDKNTSKLRAHMALNNLEAISDPSFAFYDGPWVRPAMRRNEVMIEIAAE
jgi:hypothetical protein